MGKFVWFVIGLALCAAATVTPAQAGVPIPCTGEALVKVAEVPPAMTFPGPDGKPRHVDLGYKISNCFGGEWVGLVGDDRYIKLSPPGLQLLTAMAGLKELPPPPGFWSSGSVYGPVLLWAGVIVFALAGTLTTRKGGAPQPFAPPESHIQRPGEDEEEAGEAPPAWATRASAAVARSSAGVVPQVRVAARMVAPPMPVPGRLGAPVRRHEFGRRH